MDAFFAHTPSNAVVADDVRRGDALHEHIELLFTLFCHDFSTRGVFL